MTRLHNLYNKGKKNIEYDFDLYKMVKNMKSMKFKFDILLDKLKIDKDIFLTENPLNLIYDEGVKAPTEIKISGKVKFNQMMKKTKSFKGLDGLT